MNQFIARKKKTTRGQGMVEYVALTALVAIVCIGAVKAFGGKVQRRLTQITNSFDHNIQQGLKVHTTKKDSGSGQEDGGMDWPGTGSRSHGGKKGLNWVGQAFHFASSGDEE